MSDEAKIKADVSRLRELAEAVQTGATRPTKSEEVDHWGEPGGAGGYTYRLTAPHDDLSDEVVSQEAAAKLRELADKIERGILEPMELGWQAPIGERVGDNWSGDVDAPPASSIFTVKVLYTEPKGGG